ncbi:MAG TPA: dihydrofolate reductase family protein [Hanamia sp.]|nr:dihydrofolate reductase family protein [Hanamia sp.]
MTFLPPFHFQDGGLVLGNKLLNYAEANYDAEQSPATASWAEARVFDGDLAEGIRELKSGPGKPILAIGGAGFMRSLIATGLIDEYHLVTHPVVLGGGLPIFNDAPPTP